MKTAILPINYGELETHLLLHATKQGPTEYWVHPDTKRVFCYKVAGCIHMIDFASYKDLKEKLRHAQMSRLSSDIVQRMDELREENQRLKLQNKALQGLVLPTGGGL